jgi:hypothetical protein
MTSVGGKPPSPGWGRTLAIQALVLCAIFAGVRYFSPPVTETSIDVQQRHQTAATIAAHNDDIAKQAAARSATRNQLCQLLPVCVAYKAARNDCAVAASFENCLRIKISGGDCEKLMFCNKDGTLNPVGPDDPAPDTLECWLRNNTPFYR